MDLETAVGVRPVSMELVLKVAARALRRSSGRRTRTTTTPTSGSAARASRSVITSSQSLLKDPILGTGSQQTGTRLTRATEEEEGEMLGREVSCVAALATSLVRAREMVTRGTFHQDSQEVVRGSRCLYVLPLTQ